MDIKKRTDDQSAGSAIQRTDRFIEMEEGFFIKMREGMVGPFDNLASALNGLIVKAKNDGLPNYQVNQLYQSVCEKALESCYKG